MRHHFAWHQTVHSVVGFVFFVLMLTGMIIMWHNVLGGFMNAFNTGSLFGWGGSIVVLVMCFAVGLAIVAEGLRRFANLSWGEYTPVSVLRKTHKYLCYFVLFGG
jgi:hypothetical protein